MLKVLFHKRFFLPTTELLLFHELEQFLVGNIFDKKDITTINNIYLWEGNMTNENHTFNIKVCSHTYTHT